MCIQRGTTPNSQSQATLVQPHHDYCSVVYFDATNEQKLRLERLSNSYVRYILGVRRDAHINSRRLYFADLRLYKITRMREPSYLAALFVKHKPKSTSRGIQPELVPPFVIYEVGSRPFRYRERFWNSLPPSIRHLPSYCSFKRAVRQNLFDLDA